MPKTATIHVRFEHGTEDIPAGRIWDAVAAALQNQQETTPEDANGSEETVPVPTSRTQALVGMTWKAPDDLHGKARNTVHRAVAALDKFGGRGLTVQELHERSGISLVPLYKLIKDDNPSGHYAARFIRTTKLGRSHVMDLTAEGRHLASLVRAGKVPA